MKIYRNLEDFPKPATPVVLTIGNFDGVHLGHRSVIAQVIARARELHGLALAVTFDPHPTHLLRPDHPTQLITPLERKLELLAQTGLDATLVLPFDEALCHTSAYDFAAHILRDRLGATEVHEGETFRFGYRAVSGIQGDDGLEALGHKLGFAVRIYAPRTLRGAPISSSRIRTLIAAGELHHARALLGRSFAIDSSPAAGRGYGTRYAVPTINLAPYAELLPAQGVYITTLTIGSGPKAEVFEAVTNVGNRPTFGADSFAVESHLLNFHPVHLSETTPLRLSFLRHLRNEQKFPNPEALRDQIMRDVRQAQRYFALCHTLTKQ